MTAIRKILGIFPDTASYESKRNAAYAEYQKLDAIEKSDGYKRYVELKQLTGSEDFKKRKNETLKAKYQGSPEYLTEKKFRKLSAQKGIKTYLKVESSDDLKNYTDTAGSKDLARYIELKVYVTGEAFLKIKNYHKQKSKQKFTQSDLFKTLQQYEQQKRDPKIKSYYKFIKHKHYNDFKQIDGSNILIEFEKLESEVNSAQFIEQKKSMKKKEFTESDSYKKLLRYKELKKDKALKNYYKLKQSGGYNNYIELNGSEELQAFTDLKEFIESYAYSSQKTEIEKSRFEDTPEYKKEQEYVNLEKSVAITHYFKFEKSKEFKVYQQVKTSNDLKEYQKLKEEVSSEIFVKRKEYLTQKAKERYAQSKEYQQENEFAELEKSVEIKWYFKHIKSNKYDWFKEWKLVMDEDFNNGSLDTQKWLTKYYWGDKLLNDSYSTEDEFQYITDGGNVEINEGKLQIISRKENVKGKAWHPEFGIIPREYDYTSGLINSGNCFRQKYGAFEAKIKFSSHKEILEALWMVAGQKLPHIDIAKFNGKAQFGAVWNIDNNGNAQKTHKKYSRRRFSDKFFIYSIEWTQGKMVWKINGDTVFTQTNNIPDSEMYFIISSHLYKAVNDEHLPSALEVDWIKCYQHTKYV